MRYRVEVRYLLDTNFKQHKSFIIENLSNLSTAIEEVRLSHTTYLPYLNIVGINLWVI